MANISISDLRPAGVDFFSDSESFLDDLNDNELYNVSGGSSLLCVVTAAVAVVVFFWPPQVAHAPGNKKTC